MMQNTRKQAIEKTYTCSSVNLCPCITCSKENNFSCITYLPQYRQPVSKKTLGAHPLPHPPRVQPLPLLNSWITCSACLAKNQRSLATGRDVLRQHNALGSRMHVLLWLPKVRRDNSPVVSRVRCRDSLRYG